jgi:hypothetical protein
VNLHGYQQIEPAHSPFGGSVATRILRCPASVGLVAKVPHHLRKSSAYADRGSALHAAMALLIERERSLADIVREKIDCYVITHDDVENALRPVYDYVNALLDTPDAEYYTLGHLSRFVKPGAVRIASTSFGSTTSTRFAIIRISRR